MKKTLIILLLLFVFISCNKNKDKKNNSSIKNKTVKNYTLNSSTPLLLLPEDTEVIFNIKSVKSVFTNFEIKNNSVFGISIDDEVIPVFKKLISINPLNLKELESIGIDISKEFGLAFSDILWGKYDLSSINIVAYIPIKDSKKLLSHIESKFVNGKHAEFKELSIEKKKNYTKISGKFKDQVLYFTIKNNYMFIVLNPENPQLALNTIQKLTEGKSTLKNNKLFNKTTKLIKTDKGIYIYGDVKQLIHSNQARIEKEFRYEPETGKVVINALKAYKSAVLSIEFDTNNFIMNASAILDGNSNVLSILKGIKYNNSTILGIDKTALMLMSYGINIKEYIKFLKSFMGKQGNEFMDKEIQNFNKEFGVNLQKDFIDNFDGNFGYGIYDGMSISTTNYNAVMTIGFKNAKAIETFTDKLLANKKMDRIRKYVNKTKLNNKTVYIINAMVLQVYVGFKGNELIIASGKSMYESILNSNKEKGFYKYAKNDKNLKSLLNSDIVFYISFKEVIKAVNNFKAMLPHDEPLDAVIDTLELLDYLSVDVDFTDSVISANYVLKTNIKKAFFPALADIIKKYNKKYSR